MKAIYLVLAKVFFEIEMVLPDWIHRVDILWVCNVLPVTAAGLMRENATVVRGINPGTVAALRAENSWRTIFIFPAFDCQQTVAEVN